MISRPGVAQLDTGWSKVVRAGWAWWVRLSLAATVAAATTAQRVAPIPSGRAVMEGRVAESGSSRPIADVIVTLERSGGGVLKTLTDSAGRYRFEGIGAGGYRLIATLNGYAAEEYRVVPPLMPGWAPGDIRELPEGGKIGGGVAWLRLSDGQIRRDLDIVMTRGGQLAGRVFKSDGRAAADAIVRAMLTLGDGSFTYSARTIVRSNARGEYVIGNLSPGVYRLAIQWFDPERMKARAGVEHSTIYFPGTNNVNEAMSVRLDPGSTMRNLDVRLPPVDVFRLSGHFLRGGSQGGIESHLVSGEWKVRPIDVAEDGAFDIKYVEPGRHTLWARALTADGSEAAWITIDVGPDMLGLVLPMIPTGDIRGRVVTEEGVAFAGNGYQIIAELADERGHRLDAVPRDRTDIASDGSFHLTGLFGERHLRMSGNEYAVTRIFSQKSIIPSLSIKGGERLDNVVVVVRPR